MSERVAQFAHRPFGDLHQIGFRREPRQQAALRPDRVAARRRILRQIAALDQRVQMAIDRSLGDVEPLGNLRHAHLFIRKADGLQHVDRELDRAHHPRRAIVRHDPSAHCLR